MNFDRQLAHPQAARDTFLLGYRRSVFLFLGCLTPCAFVLYSSRTRRTQGEKVPPPIKSFREMKLPEPMLAALEAKGIKRPTPIQARESAKERLCSRVDWRV